MREETQIGLSACPFVDSLPALNRIHATSQHMPDPRAKIMSLLARLRYNFAPGRHSIGGPMLCQVMMLAAVGPITRLR